MTDDRKYSRVYHEAIEDNRFRDVWPDDACLALWVRLLVAADGTWPAPAPVPRRGSRRALDVLVSAGLVELVGGGDYCRIHGLDAERKRRSDRGRRGADARWHSDADA